MNKEKLKNSNMIEYDNLIAFHPGYYIRDIIEDMEMTQDEFSTRLGTTSKTLSKIINGSANISNDIAMKLSIMLNTSIDVWINLQLEYDKKIIEINKRMELNKQKELIKLIDYSYFVKNGFLRNAENSTDKINGLCSFLKISNLNALLVRDLYANFRTTINVVKEKNILNANIWLMIAMNAAREKEVKPYSEALLKSYIKEIRNMTIQPCEIFMPKLKKIFSECGVVFLVVPSLKNAGINGAVKWINQDKALIAMNDRRKYSDIFWFSLFHEIKHVFQHKTKTTLMNGENELIENNNSLEREADLYSRNSLIPINEYKCFISQKDFSEKNIKKFAKSIGIHPGLVVGRLEHDKLLNYQSYQNKLREKYSI